MQRPVGKTCILKLTEMASCTNTMFSTPFCPLLHPYYNTGLNNGLGKLNQESAKKV